MRKAKPIERCAGVWIDHNKAFIVDSARGEANWVTIKSEVESQHRTMGQKGVALPGHLGCNPESHYQNRREQQLQRHYDRVIDALGDAPAFLILGPGEAGLELWKRMQHRGCREDQLIALEHADKMAISQLGARVRAVVPEPQTRSLKSPVIAG